MGSYLYANGVASSKEGELLSTMEKNKIMEEPVYSQALKLLYSSTSYSKYSVCDDYHVVLTKAMQELLDFIRLESPSKEVLRYFLLPVDMNNISNFCKAKLMDKSVEDVIKITGNYSLSEIKAYINKKEYGYFKDKYIEDLLRKFDGLKAKEMMPQDLDFFFKREKYRALTNICKTKILKELVKREIDMENLSSLVRQNGKENPKFLEGGSIGLDILCGLLKEDESYLSNILDQDLLSLAKLKFIKKDSSFETLEIRKHELLLKYAKRYFADIESPAPFVCYILKKIMEIQNLRAILSLKATSLGERIQSHLLKV